MMPRSLLVLLAVVASDAFTVAPRARSIQVFFAEKNEDEVDRTSFDQAGQSLIEEEDRKRMEEMGDFDSNPAYQNDSIEKMRAAIRARTESMGIEKSKVSADYIAQRERQAMSAGSAKAAGEDSNSFGGLDLSQISDRATKADSWNEDLPSMLYNPEDDLSKEEQEEVDPVMTKNPVEQGLSELGNAKWPDAGSAFREVILMLVVIAGTAALIIGWDNILRQLYTSIGFIPSKEDLANYASRFDGLDLPDGWTNNMNEADVSQFVEKVNTATTTSGLPEL